MHVCMYACMHVCMYACIHACMYACMHVCMHACMHVCMYACTIDVRAWRKLCSRGSRGSRGSILWPCPKTVATVTNPSHPPMSECGECLGSTLPSILPLAPHLSYYLSYSLTLSYSPERVVACDLVTGRGWQPGPVIGQCERRSEGHEEPSDGNGEGDGEVRAECVFQKPATMSCVYVLYRLGSHINPHMTHLTPVAWVSYSCRHDRDGCMVWLVHTGVISERQDDCTGNWLDMYAHIWLFLFYFFFLHIFFLFDTDYAFLSTAPTGGLKLFYMSLECLAYCAPCSPTHHSFSFPFSPLFSGSFSPLSLPRITPSSSNLFYFSLFFSPLFLPSCSPFSPLSPHFHPVLPLFGPLTPPLPPFPPPFWPDLHRQDKALEEVATDLDTLNRRQTDAIKRGRRIVGGRKG